MEISNKRTKTGFLIFLGWLVYTTSYLGKLNYSANITQIIDFYNVTKPEAGLPPTFLFFGYGIGQAVNGILCKRYNMKTAIFGSLFLSGIINLIIAITSNFAIVKWLWLINGFTLSILWPTIVRLMSESLPKKDLGKSSVILGTTVAIGTLIIYGLSSVFAIFDSFKLAFYTAGFAGIAVAFFWYVSYNKAFSLAKSEKDAEDISQNIQKTATEKNHSAHQEDHLLIISICVLCLCGICVNLVKDGLTTWVPSILKDEYSITDSLSILLTLLLPIVAIFGNTYALTVHKKVPDYVTHCLVIFLAIAGVIGIIIGSLFLKQAIIMIICLSLASFLASSLNSLITSIYPMFMRDKINSGMCAGILNSFCYLGSTISSYGLGFIAENHGWNSVFYSLIIFCGVVCIFCLGFILIKRIFKRKFRI